jgi:LAO/AO transport system kinase
MTNGINDKYQYNPKQFLSEKEFISGINVGDKTVISQAITLSESNHPSHRKLANQLISKLKNPKKPTIRIGITGIPGVGKSSFIEEFGLLLSKKGLKVAILTIDPSSEKSGGSILGDKTRMNELSKQKNVFIRPTPTKGTLGGVGRNTKEAILICEAAGFDVIIIETVGVGQSETNINKMVDFFLLLMLAGAGDELQGIKRGIMELADCIAITKADSGNELQAKKAKITYKNALHLFPPNSNGWIPTVHVCSSYLNKGISNIWNTIKEHRELIVTNGWLDENRSNQNIFWMNQRIEEQLKIEFYEIPNIKESIKSCEKDVKSGKINPFLAADQILKNR